MNVEHDRQHDLAYFAFSSVESTRQLRLDPGRIVDYGPNDEVVGVEFISPSRGISLAGVPRAVEIEREARRLGLTISVPATAA